MHSVLRSHKDNSLTPVVHDTYIINVAKYFLIVI
jgi:hypothetical protein